MKGEDLKIQYYGSPYLRQQAKDVDLVDDEIRGLLEKMLEIMYKNKGIGLAGNQVGILKRMIVLDVGEGPLRLINPEIKKREGRINFQEGCLSLPELVVNVKRAEKIEVEALDEKGRPLDIKAEGLLAICLQHEVDHLRGKLIVDYLPWLKRIREIKKLKEAVRNAKVCLPLEESRCL